MTMVFKWSIVGTVVEWLKAVVAGNVHFHNIARPQLLTLVLMAAIKGAVAADMLVFLTLNKSQH